MWIFEFGEKEKEIGFYEILVKQERERIDGDCWLKLKIRVRKKDSKLILKSFNLNFNFYMTKKNKIMGLFNNRKGLLPAILFFTIK